MKKVDTTSVLVFVRRAFPYYNHNHQKQGGSSAGLGSISIVLAKIQTAWQASTSYYCHITCSHFSLSFISLSKIKWFLLLCFLKHVRIWTNCKYFFVSICSLLKLATNTPHLGYKSNTTITWTAANHSQWLTESVHVCIIMCSNKKKKKHSVKAISQWMSAAWKCYLASRHLHFCRAAVTGW